MTLLRLVIISLAMFVLAPGARASTSSCANAVNGTACVTTCIAAGTCQAKVCVPTQLRPDGTPCSAENLCTSGDQCMAGACVAGSTVVCPDVSECQKGYCEPSQGCVVVNVCTADLASDAGPPPDAGPRDLAIVPVNDMCFYDPSLEFITCNGEDGFYQVPLDSGLLGDAGVDVPFHVRGSRIGDCAIGGSDGTLYGSILLVLAALYYACRARPLATVRAKSASARDRRAPPRL